MPNGAKKMEGIQQKFVVLYQNRFFSHGHVAYGYCLEVLKLHNPYDIRLHLVALFFVSVHSGLKCCVMCLLWILPVFGVLPRNFRNSSLLTVTCKTSRFASCVAAANLVCKYVDIFMESVTQWKQLLH